VANFALDRRTRRWAWQGGARCRRTVARQMSRAAAARMSRAGGGRARNDPRRREPNDHDARAARLTLDLRRARHTVEERTQGFA